MPDPLPRDFIVRIPARFLKDAGISADAKALRAVLGAYADGHTRRAYVQPRTLEKLLGWGRRRREAAQREAVAAGWLALGWKRAAHGLWARRVYILAVPSAASSAGPSPGPSPRNPPLRGLSAAAKTRNLFIDHVQETGSQLFRLGQSRQVRSGHQ